ncbi:MAG: AraC family transcriptional regulator [Paenibacillaceae bacterium]|nr:AraC family transcriptional regulator [Paenibacillaceae bacterium]
MATFMDYTISPLPLRIVDLLAGESQLRVRSLRVTQVGHLPGRTLQRERIAFGHWAVLYIIGGEGGYRVDDGGLQPVGSGDLMTMRPGAHFSFGPTPGRYWDEYYISFAGERIEEWLAAGLLQPDVVRRVGVDDTWVQRIERMMKLLENGIPADADRAALAFESLLYEFAQAGDGGAEGARNGLFHKLYETLAGDLYREHDAAAVAALFHISESTLRRLVKKTTGYSFGEYVHRLKMAEAKKLLLNTEMKSKEIAGLLGYSDEFYFSRTFKRIAGMAPGRLRSEYEPGRAPGAGTEST